MYEDYNYTKSNREKALSPKADGKFWCEKCDRDLVANWQKCKSCGHRNGTRTIKQDY